MSAEDLALAVKARRAELGLTKQRQITERAGPSIGVVRNIERAANDSYAGTTLGALDRALDWTPGSARAALFDGSAPTIKDTSKAAADARAMRIGYAVLALLKELES